jgi:endonuclease YncB( thermonuclease family)
MIRPFSIAGFFTWAAVSLSLCASETAVAAESVFKGPVVARVLEVLDGDTFLAEAHVWPDQFVRVNVRIRGIDTPEMKARCDVERVAARRAREVLAQLLEPGTVAISNIGSAKYYGRVLADVITPDGELVADILVAEGLARPYQGGQRAGWCG